MDPPHWHSTIVFDSFAMIAPILTKFLTTILRLGKGSSPMTKGRNLKMYNYPVRRSSYWTYENQNRRKRTRSLMISSRGSVRWTHQFGSRVACLDTVMSQSYQRCFSCTTVHHTTGSERSRIDRHIYRIFLLPFLSLSSRFIPLSNPSILL